MGVPGGAPKLSREKGTFLTTIIDGLLGTRSSLVRLSTFRGMVTVRLRDESSIEEPPMETGKETTKKGSDASPVLGTNTYRNASRGRNPEHHLEDLHSIGKIVVVMARGT